MSKISHPNNGRDALEHMTKPQLRQQLAETLEILKQEDAQLAAYQTQIKETKAEIGDLRELTGRTHALEKELEEARARLQEISADLTKFRKENEDLTRANYALRKDNEELQSRLHAAEEQASRQLNITKRQNQEAERHRLQLEGKVHDLESRIHELQKATITLKEKLAHTDEPEEKMADSVSASKASFRIDLYAQEGDYQGKIEHLLSREKKAFKGLEQNEIMQFVLSHLPHLEKQKQGKTAHALSIPEAAPTPEIKKPVDGHVFLRELKIMQAGHEHFAIGEKKPLQIQLQMDLSTVSPTDIPLFYKLTVYAKNLESKTREKIGETARMLNSAGIFPISFQTRILPVGVYRLQADLISKLKDGKTAKYASFVEGGVVQIY